MNRIGCTLTLVLSTAVGIVMAQGETLLGVDPAISNIPLDQVLRGNPQPNGIPSIGHEGDWLGWTPPTPAPQFVSQEEASEWIGDREPVVALELNGEARAYPLQILTYHEIVNDSLGGFPVAITFCPLCNSSIAFDRRAPLTAELRDALLARNPAAPLTDLDQAFLDAYAFQNGELPDFTTSVEVTFGTSGLLYNSNLLMFDSQGSTLWSQILGQGNVGILTGVTLLNYPAQVISFEEFRASYPDSVVLSRETGFSRPYGNNPYPGYDDIGSPAFLFIGPDDDRLLAKSRVVSVELRGEAVAYPWEVLTEARVVNDRIGDLPVTIFWKGGTGSAIDSAVIADGEDVGAVGVFSRNLDGRILSFSWDGDGFIDAETNSRWNLAGQAIEGGLAGSQLQGLPHDNTLWFAWAAFRPETRIYGVAE